MTACQRQNAGFPGFAVAVGLVVVLARLAGSPPIPAADLPDNMISVVVGFERHAAVNRELDGQIRLATTRFFRSLSGRQLVWSTMPEQLVAAAEGRKGLAGLTVSDCRSHQLGRSPQTLLLWVGYGSGTYRLSCAVFNRDFNDVIFSRDVKLVDRQLVVNNLVRLVSRIWCPVGRVTGKSGPHLLVSLFQRVSSSEPTVVTRDTPLDVVRLFGGTDGIQRTSWGDDFLVVHQLQQGIVQARSEKDPETIPRFFRFLDDSRFRYLVRVIKPQRVPTVLQIVSAEDGSPRECCAVFVRDKERDRECPRGIPTGFTDEAGLFTVPVIPSGYRYVTVVRGSRFVSLPIVGGRNSAPIKIRLPRETPRKDLERAGQRIRKRLIESNLLIATLNDQANSSARDEDEKSVEHLLKSLKRDPGYDRIRDELQRLKDGAVEKNLDVEVKRVDRWLAEVATFRRDWQLAIQSTTTNLRKTRVKKLTDEYESARNQFQWVKVVGILEGIVRVDPSHLTARTLLDRFQRALPDHSAAHAEARSLARELVQSSTAAEVLLRWNQLTMSVKQLVREKDGPVLRELRSGLAENEKLLAAEAKAAAARANDDDLEEDERKRLEIKLQELEKALKELSEARKRAFEISVAFFRVTKP